MAGETQIVLVGNVVDEQAELRFTPAGAAVAKFRMASTPRTYDRQSGQFKDGEPLFMTVNVWRQQAEHVAEVVKQGMRVVVVGQLRQRSFETKSGEKRTVFEVEAEDVAVSLKFATATVEKATRAGFQPDRRGGQGGQGGQQGGWGQQGPAGDPWSQSAGQASGGWGGDEPAPF